MSKWQNIETAPKDGTEILACYSRKHGNGQHFKEYSIVKWDSSMKDWVARADGTDVIKAEGWYGAEYLYPYINFWQPMPEIDIVEE